MGKRTYLVTQGGVTTEHEMSEEMAASFDRAQALWLEHGCHCGNPSGEAHTIPRGHSVDALCVDCGGWLQIG